MLAYAHLSRPFDYNKMQLAPMGCGAQVHEKTKEMADGHIIWLIDGISSHCRNIIAHIIFTSSTPRANNYPTWSNFNSSATPIPPSLTPTKWMQAFADCIKAIQGMTSKPQSFQAAQDLQHIVDAIQAHVHAHPNSFAKTATSEAAHNTQHVPRVQAPPRVPGCRHGKAPELQAINK
jgi:hypothetical protein